MNLKTMTLGRIQTLFPKIRIIHRFIKMVRFLHSVFDRHNKNAKSAAGVVKGRIFYYLSKLK